MTPPRICSAIIALALIHAPLATQAQMITVSNCNGSMSLLVIPADGNAPGNRDNDCAKACHAMCERRGKGATRQRAA